MPSRLVIFVMSRLPTTSSMVKGEYRAISQFSLTIRIHVLPFGDSIEGKLLDKT